MGEDLLPLRASGREEGGRESVQVGTSVFYPFVGVIVLSPPPTLLSAFKWPHVLGQVPSGNVHRWRCIKGSGKAALVTSFWNEVILESS